MKLLCATSDVPLLVLHVSSCELRDKDSLNAKDNRTTFYSISRYSIVKTRFILKRYYKATLIFKAGRFDNIYSVVN